MCIRRSGDSVTLLFVSLARKVDQGLPTVGRPDVPSNFHAANPFLLFERVVL